MPLLGAHMSIAGGYYKAVQAAAQSRCDCVQLFTKNNNQWRAKPIDAADVQRFQDALKQLCITHPIAHSSYLINLATPDAPLWRKSIDAMIVELQRAQQLGLPYVVVHPGSYTTSSEQAGLLRVAQAVDEVHRQHPHCSARILLETTAGQGTNLGWKFEHLAEILAMIRDPDRVAVCFDTCHVFAAGYPLGDQQSYPATMRQFDQTVGLPQIRAIHLNDSKRELGSRVDRHEHIGQGQLGKEAFRLLLNDPQFHTIPMYLETPKQDERGRDMDRLNLRRLRRLIQ